MTDIERHTDMEQVRQVLLSWASATRAGKLDEILKNHHRDVLIFDVLAPVQYEGADAYRASWEKWHPKTQGEIVFDFTDLKVAAGGDLAFASGLIRCGGTLQDGRTFTDLVRATFCLEKLADQWIVTHQHISKPAGT